MRDCKKDLSPAEREPSADSTLSKSVVLPSFVLWSRCEGNIIKYYTIIIIEILHYVYNFRELLLEQTRLS